ncbi:uncharacterized protein LOC125957700 [Anopheles darlingi]|uniref:uncharacterized protein LOC125957700 n=1 Tax=Anopheles darlingi TaxID=43151 RepID=UPI0021002C17|nr:uncharacterized protein LOC125957700 [Anopheles darlingi]
MASCYVMKFVGLLLVVALMVFGVDSRASSSADLLRSDADRGQEASRVARSPQQQQGFPNFPPPQFPFGNPEIVSQDTQRDKNGFAQTTIYKYPNGMGSSSVSTSYSGSPKMTSTSGALVLGAALAVCWKLLH